MVELIISQKADPAIPASVLHLTEPSLFLSGTELQAPEPPSGYFLMNKLNYPPREIMGRIERSCLTPLALKQSLKTTYLDCLLVPKG